jgi:hypothetical protein
MLETIYLFCQIMLIISLFSLFAGLIKPVLVLWFLDRFNRLKVIRIYGALSLIFALLCLFFWWLG